MRIALDIIFAGAGVVVIFLVDLSAVTATILPRGVQTRLGRISILSVRLLFRLIVGRTPTYARRDRIMALLGPVSLLALLGMWLVGMFGAFILVFLATATHSPQRAVELSGSSLFTLGTTSAGRLGPDLISYFEAGEGLLLLTLLITYLPSIYGAFSRRENGVSLLRVRAGSVPQASTMLIRYHRIEDAQYRLADVWQTWEGWFVDVEETHTSFPALPFFRSPQPEQSWITAAGTILDAASFWVAAVEHPRDPDAQLCIRAGFQALRRIGALYDLDYDVEPQYGDPITIDRQEWDEAMDEMAEAGVSLLPDRDQAWADWKGWRVNYDTVLLNLARMVEAPPAPWVSDRSPLRREQAWTLRRAIRLTSRSIAVRRSPCPGGP